MKYQVSFSLKKNKMYLCMSSAARDGRFKVKHYLSRVSHRCGLSLARHTCERPRYAPVGQGPVS